MTRTTLAVLFVFHVCAILTTPAAAQSGGCTGDFNCSEPKVVATWPLDLTKAIRQATGPAQ
jgi:hypothetical protein